ncbi:MAG: hypothetical protein JO161_08695 [Planctomycetaceae bacterium]|nr:hypothetical protein [Planctomycetaceae bacterium]
MAETFTGEVRGGVVVFEGSPPFPDGTKVRIERVETDGESAETLTLAERLESVIGTAVGLPADLAAQHDHYLHGLPKR